MRELIRVHGLKYALVALLGIAAWAGFVVFAFVFAGWGGAIIGGIDPGLLVPFLVVFVVVSFDDSRRSDGPPGLWNGDRTPCAACGAWLRPSRETCPRCGAAVMHDRANDAEEASRTITTTVGGPEAEATISVAGTSGRVSRVALGALTGVVIGGVVGFLVGMIVVGFGGTGAEELGGAICVVGAFLVGPIIGVVLMRRRGESQPMPKHVS